MKRLQNVQAKLAGASQGEKTQLPPGHCLSGPEFLCCGLHASPKNEWRVNSGASSVGDVEN